MRLALSLLFITVISLPGGYCKDGSLLPFIDPQIIVASLKHTQSLLRTGKCRIKYRSYHKLANYKMEFEAIFAFDSHRVCYHFISDVTVSDLKGKEKFSLREKGCRDLYETRTQTKLMIGTKRKGIIPVLVERGSSPFDYSWDPRNYGIRIRGFPPIPLGEFLEKKGVKIVRVEKVRREGKEILCYLAETEEEEEILGKVRLWLDPKKGFLPLKMQTGDHWFMDISYKPYESDDRIIWFLEKGIRRCKVDRYVTVSYTHLTLPTKRIV